MTETTVTFSEFARQRGWSPSYVTKLKESGRLVLTDDGKRIRTEESLARIKATEDPNRDDVRERHVKARETGVAPQTPLTDRAGPTFASSRAIMANYAALIAEIDYRLRIRSLADTASVRTAGTEAGTVLRAALENLPDQVAPLLAEGDPEREERIRTKLVEHVGLVLTEISDKLRLLSEQFTEVQA